MAVRRPAPSPLEASASMPARCESLWSATRARSTTSCVAPQAGRTTKPVPHASWSGCPWENVLSIDFDKWRQEKREIENLDSCYTNFEETNPRFFGGQQS